MYQEKPGDGEDVEKKGGMPVMETRQFEVPPRTIVGVCRNKYLWPCLYGRGHKFIAASAKTVFMDAYLITEPRYSKHPVV